MLWRSWALPVTAADLLTDGQSASRPAVSPDLPYAFIVQEKGDGNSAKEKFVGNW
jgi:hypothetical protein